MIKNKFLMALIIVLLCFFIILLINWAPSSSTLDNNIDKVKVDEEKVHSINHNKVFQEMFPNSQYPYGEFEAIDNNIIRMYRDDKNHYDDFSIENIIYDKFIESKNEYLVIIRKLNTSHQEGLYKVFMGIFDLETNTLISPVHDISSDQGDFGFFKGKEKTYIMFVGSTTYNGWEEYYGDLYDVTRNDWKNVLPKDNKFWENKRALISKDGLIIYKREIVGRDNGAVIPDYRFVYDYEMIWDELKSNFTIEKNKKI
ncbi:hypothetical protein [Sporosalibacterium faouarense]|uniref:hypothetical protein n=1 Tax=Sporosalibacterium faouarense TaxID=516123 RepID=UPI00192C4A1F|nr:hypothetical protein [Sporosalibacterium faouarense]